MMKQLLSGKVWLGGLIVALVLTFGTVAVILVQQATAPTTDPGFMTAVLTILPAPTGTPHPMPATLTPLPPTPTLPPSPAPGEFGVGAYVQISNTGLEGLNIRTEAGLGAPVIFSGFDSEVFLVTDGPKQADGYTWWQLTASYDPGRTGWAAQTFLTVISSP